VSRARQGAGAGDLVEGRFAAGVRGASVGSAAEQEPDAVEISLPGCREEILASREEGHGLSLLSRPRRWDASRH